MDRTMRSRNKNNPSNLISFYFPIVIWLSEKHDNYTTDEFHVYSIIHNLISMTAYSDCIIDNVSGIFSGEPKNKWEFLLQDVRG